MAKFTGHLKGLRDLLGTLHDSAVMTGLQKGLLDGRNKRRLTRFAGKLQNRRATQAKELRRVLKQRWESLAQAERPWTGTAVAH